MRRLLVMLLLLWPAVALAGSVNSTGTCPGVTLTQGTMAGCSADVVAPANTLNDFGNLYNAHWHTYDAATLTNQTGGGLVAGDVVALSTANDLAVAINDSQTSRRTFVVAMGTIANTAAGEFARSGIASVKAQGTINRGEYVRKSATSKALESTGTAMGTDTTVPDGTIGIALGAASGGFVATYLFGRTVALDALVAGSNVTITPGTRQNTIASSAGGGLVDVNYLFNANFEIWGAGTGTTNPPTGWTISTGAMASNGKDTTNFKYGLASAALNRTGGANVKVIQNAAATYAPIGPWRSQAVVFGCWVRATVATRARLGVDDGVGSANSSYHTGGSAFEWLTVSRTLDASATKVEVQLLVDTGNTTAQFDGCVLTRGSVAPADYFPDAWRGRKGMLAFWGLSTTNPGYFSTGFSSPTETSVQGALPYKGVLRRMVCRAVANLSTTQTFRRGAADTALTCAYSSSQQCSDTTNEVEVAALTDLVAVKTTDTTSVSQSCLFEYEEIP